MQHSLKDSQHLLQKYGVLIEFDIISVTSLEDFIKKHTMK